MEMTELVNSLTHGLKPVAAPKPALNIFLKWSVGATAAVILEFVATGGFRPDYIEQLFKSPRYMVETIIGFLMVYVSGYVAILMRTPDDGRHRAIKFLPFILLDLFSISVISGYFSPVLPASEEHHRYFCETLILLFGIFPTAYLYSFLSEGASTEPAWSGALLGLAALGLPTALMQVGCMYSAYHVLFHHVIPLWIMITLASRIFGKKLRIS